jgi:hypothetical protein
VHRCTDWFKRKERPTSLAQQTTDERFYRRPRAHPWGRDRRRESLRGPFRRAQCRPSRTPRGQPLCPGGLLTGEEVLSFNKKQKNSKEMGGCAALCRAARSARGQPPVLPGGRVKVSRPEKKRKKKQTFGQTQDKREEIETKNRSRSCASRWQEYSTGTWLLTLLVKIIHREQLTAV